MADNERPARRRSAVSALSAISAACGHAAMPDGRHNGRWLL